MIVRQLLISGLFTLFVISKTFAATYYVDGSAAGDSGYGSISSPKKYIKSGIALMSGGDTLIIKDGVYTGDNNMLSNASGWEYNSIPNGSAGAYTTIKAENYLGAVIDGENARIPAYINGNSYVRIENIHFRNCGILTVGSNVIIAYSDHIKVIKCASEEAYNWHFRLQYSNYVLFEDCFTWGRGAYHFVAKGASDDFTQSAHNVYRRCVARRDAHYYAPGGNNHGSFVAYYSDNSHYQNCISIDHHYIYAGEGSDPGFVKASYYIANGASNYNVQGCLAINEENYGMMFEAGPTNVIINNSAFLQSTTTSDRGVLFRDTNTFNITNSILAYSDSDAIYESGTSVLQSCKNNLIFGNNAGFQDVGGTHTYNILYNNGTHYAASSVGTGERTDINPLTNGLKYPVRIESGSFLSTAGESGGRSGPEVLKKIGVSGTLYGETGWNTVTSEDLWPFPNEDVIKQKMSTCNLHGANGARGFCATGQTLTKYIWEYLGNTIPVEIYGGGGSNDTIAPAAINNLSASAVGPGQIRLIWTAPGDDANTGTASSYIIRYATSAITTDAQYNAATDVIGEPTPTAAGSTQSATISGFIGRQTYYFAMKTLDEVPNISDLSNCASAVITNNPPVLASIGNKSVNTGINLSFTISATDPDGDVLGYSASNLPIGATFNTSTKTFSWTPASGQAGSYQVTFNVSDGISTDSETITITVNNAGQTIASGITITASATPVSGTAPLSVNFTASATSKNGLIVRYEWDFEGNGNYAWKSSQAANTTYVYSGAGNYLATLRVTDALGVQDTYSILIQPQQNSNAPNETVTTDRTSGTAPLKVYFKVNASSGVGIAKYEWDFDGDGIYAYESTRSGNVVKTYSKSGTYVARLRITDFSALSTTKDVTLNILDNSLAPKVDLGLSSASGTVPYTTTLTVNNRGDNNLLRYEWDFNGDGIYDRSTYTTNQVTYTYMRAGTFRPCVRVTNKNNLTSTATALVTIKDNTSLTRPVASFTTSPSQGEVPLKVTLTNQSQGTIDSSIWDFNGDKTDDYALLGKPNVSYFYDGAGYYLVNLKVIGTNGLMDESAKQIKITALNSTPIVLIEPKDSEVLKGKISLAVLIDPRISPTQVKYQYQLQGTSSWIELGTATTYPYSMIWDTANVANNNYLIRATATNSNNQNFVSASITIIINSQFATPDAQGNVLATGEYVNQVKIDSSKLEEIYLFDGTQIEMPYQAVNQDDVLSITIVDPDQLANKINSSNPNITDINSYRNISLASNTSLLDKEVMMKVPYDDKDNDGYVDGTTIKEETLDIYTYDEVTQEWTKIFDCIVHPNENFVEGKTNHFTLFGLGGTPDAAAGSPGGSGSNGGGGGGGGGGCFIATAAYGTTMAKEVRALSKFRDKYLLPNEFGKRIVQFYWHVSPPISEYIRNREWAKTVVRVVLKPAVWIAQSLL